MRILRVVHDYWPGVGGNERWSFLHDKWFSEIAQDEVQVLVVRPESFFEAPGYREQLAEYRQIGEIDIPLLPRVKVFQTVIPNASRVRLAYEYYKTIRPWVRKRPDIVITQIEHFHARPCWRGVPVVYEPGSALASSRRRRPSATLAHRIRKQLAISMYRRFQVIVTSPHLLYQDVKDLNLEHKVFMMRHIVDPTAFWGPLTTEQHELAVNNVNSLASQHGFVLAQFNRLHSFKNPEALLDIAEQMPECAVVFAGDGPEMVRLQARVEGSPHLRNRVIFLGNIDVRILGTVTEAVSAFVMTSPHGNYNTVFTELLALGNAPVIAIDTDDFPDEIDKQDTILKITQDPKESAARIRSLLMDNERKAKMVGNGKRYVADNHSVDQMWDYRERLLQTVREFRSRKRFVCG